jgi:DNA segregation ATPase FtsK/SpoIIIE, S-DNA-T family
MTAAVGDLVTAAELIVRSQWGSRDMLARKLRLAKGEAAELLEELELAGVVGPPTETGARPVTFTSDELAEALAKVRQHAARERLIVESEALDEAHGGEVVLRGGLGADVAHPAGTGLEVRPDGDVELADEPPDEPPHLIGRLVERPVHVITTLAESDQARQLDDALRATPRILLRAVVTTLQGYESAVKRAYSAATHGVLREQVRQARAAHDPVAVSAAMAELKAAKKIRSDLLKDLPGAVGGVVTVGVSALVLLHVALFVGGVAVWWSEGGMTWDDWWGGVGTAYDFVGLCIRWVAWLLLWAAIPTLLLLGYREGRRVGQAPRWLVTDDERAELDSEIDERMIALALAHIGIARLTQFFKDGGQLTYIVPPRQDGDGTFAKIDLCLGVTAQEIAEPKPRAKLAGNLKRSGLECWPTKGDEDGILDLWVADKGKLNAGAGEWPLLHDGVVDAFEGVPCGKSQRGDVILAPLFEMSYLIGGRPGQGKSAFLRTLLLGAALDPTAELWVHVMGESPDFDPFLPRLSRYAKGLDDSVYEQAIQSLRDAVAEMERRGKVLGAQPGGPPKTSRQLANKAALGLHLLFVALDEVHELFQHKEYGKEAAELAVRLIKRGRKYGIILLLATQSPTKDSLPRDVTRNIACGVAFSVQDHVANDGLLGSGKFKAGIRATELRMKVDRGTCVTVGLTDNPFELIRSFYVALEDGVDEVTPVIARAMAGVKELRRTGAAGALEAAAVDHLRDVWEVLKEPREELRDVLPRLRDRDEETYRSWNQSRLGDFLEGEGVRVGTLKGYKTVLAADVEEALTSRGGGGDDDDS